MKITYSASSHVSLLPTMNSWRLITQFAVNTQMKSCWVLPMSFILSRFKWHMICPYTLPYPPQLNTFLIGSPRIKKKRSHSSRKEKVHQFLINSVQNNQEQNVPQLWKMLMFSCRNLLICHFEVTCQTKNIYLFELDC